MCVNSILTFRPINDHHHYLEEVYRVVRVIICLLGMELRYIVEVVMEAHSSGVNKVIFMIFHVTQGPRLLRG